MHIECRNVHNRVQLNPQDATERRGQVGKHHTDIEPRRVNVPRGGGSYVDQIGGVALLEGLDDGRLRYLLQKDQIIDSIRERGAGGLGEAQRVRRCAWPRQGKEGTHHDGRGRVTGAEANQSPAKTGCVECPKTSVPPSHGA